MYSDVRSRIQRLMQEQAEEAGQPVSHATLESAEPSEVIEQSSGSSEPETVDPPSQTPEPVEDVPAPETVPPPETETVDPPSQPIEETAQEEEPESQPITPPEDWSAPESATDMTVPDASDIPPETPQESRDQPDWQSMLGYVGDQANDELFDGLATRLAESTHRALNRVQDRFDQRMAELDIGNSY